MMSRKDLQEKILELENYIKETKKNISKAEENIKQCEKAIQALKDISWDKQSKKESSQMYKVLKENKDFTQVKSEIGNIKVDKDFMEKEIKKHLDNLKLRGMVTTKEMLSFPKVVKSVRAEFNKEHKDFTWRVKANDESILIYGSREFIQNDNKINRLLTTHSKTENGERKQVGEDGQTKSTLPPLFNDSNFRKSADNTIIPQKTTKETKTEFKQGQIKAMQEAVKRASQNINSNKNMDIEL